MMIRLSTLPFRKRYLLAALLPLAIAVLDPLTHAADTSLPGNPAPESSPAVTTPSVPGTGTPSTGINGTMHAPIKAGGVMAMDLPDSSARSMTLDIAQGRFSDYSVGRLVLTATGIDFRSGTLQGLKSDITDGNFDNMPVDKLNITVPGFAFDTMQLLNSRTFVLTKPVTGKVSLTLSEQGINRFISNPKTLEKIEKSLRKQTGGLKLVTLSNPNFALQSGGKVKLTVTSTVAQGLTVPMEMLGKLVIRNGQLAISGMSLTSGGNNVQLPVDMASTFESKINELIDFRRLGKNALVITADSMKQSGKSLSVDGHATITKLSFGG